MKHPSKDPYKWSYFSVLFSVFPFLFYCFLRFSYFSLEATAYSKLFVYLDLCSITADLMFFRCEEATYTESNSRS